MAIFEFRNYFVHDGQMDAWLRLMEGEVIPFAVECGTVFCGSFVDLDDPTARGGRGNSDQLLRWID